MPCPAAKPMRRNINLCFTAGFETIDCCNQKPRSFIHHFKKIGVRAKRSLGEFLQVLDVIVFRGTYVISMGGTFFL